VIITRWVPLVVIVVPPWLEGSVTFKARLDDTLFCDCPELPLILSQVSQLCIASTCGSPSVMMIVNAFDCVLSIVSLSVAVVPMAVVLFPASVNVPEPDALIVTDP